MNVRKSSVSFTLKTEKWHFRDSIHYENGGNLSISETLRINGSFISPLRIEHLGEFDSEFIVGDDQVKVHKTPVEFTVYKRDDLPVLGSGEKIEGVGLLSFHSASDSLDPFFVGFVQMPSGLFETMRATLASGFFGFYIRFDAYSFEMENLFNKLIYRWDPESKVKITTTELFYKPTS